MTSSQNSSSGTDAGAMTKTLAASAAVFFIAMAAVTDVTEGFRVLTTEDARRLSIAESPRAIPDTPVQFSSGHAAPLPQLLRDDDRVTILSFIYTRCNSICSVMGTEFQQLQEVIDARGLDKQVRLLSISFDPTDDRQQLAAYTSRMRARPDIWQVASIPDAARRRALLEVFGITVIPAPLGEFQHNGAFHVVSPDGFLVGIVDYDAPDLALALALREAERNAATVPGKRWM